MVRINKLQSTHFAAIWIVPRVDSEKMNETGSHRFKFVPRIVVLVPTGIVKNSMPAENVDVDAAWSGEQGIHDRTCLRNQLLPTSRHSQRHEQFVIGKAAKTFKPDCIILRQKSPCCFVNPAASLPRFQVIYAAIKPR